MTEHTTVGIDLAKSVFYVVVLGAHGQVTQRKKLRRNQVLRFVAQLPAESVIAMEACGSAHHWGREIQALGYTARLLPPQHVKGYLRGQKNDYNDALAIAEACRHGAVRAVVIKRVEQQDAQAVIRIRQQLSGQRTALINQVRGLLAERGIIVSQGVSAFRRQVPELLAQESALSPRFKVLLARQYEQFLWLDSELGWYTEQLKQQAKTDETCRRLQTLPGVGPIVSTVVQGWMGDGQQFRRGRDAAAALGLVPRQHSSGGKPKLLGITKRGDSYVRSQVVHGARAVVRHAAGKDDSLSRWINRLVARRGHNKAVVALANKLVRMAWVIVTRNENYCPEPV